MIAVHLPEKRHLSWCPDSGPGILQQSSVELELKPEKAAQRGEWRCLSTYRVTDMFLLNRQTLDLEGAAPIFSPKEAFWRDACSFGHLGEFGHRRTISRCGSMKIPGK